MRDWNAAKSGFQSRLVVVFSLPMRDWNTAFIFEKKAEHIKFLAYLWGIETPWRTTGEFYVYASF